MTIVGSEVGVRGLPKWGWLLLVIVLPLVGSIVWFIAGRPVAGGRGYCRRLDREGLRRSAFRSMTSPARSASGRRSNAVRANSIVDDNTRTAPRRRRLWTYGLVVVSVVALGVVVTGLLQSSPEPELTTAPSTSASESGPVAPTEQTVVEEPVDPTERIPGCDVRCQVRS